MRGYDRTPVVLLADDDELLRRAIGDALILAGCAVVEARDGSEGLDAYRACRPDLIVTDLEMPVVDGFELIREVRRSDGVPILVLSVHGREEEKVAALDLGADDYVTKPFAVGELMARIRAEIRRVMSPRTSQGAVLRFPGLEIDLERHVVRQGGREVRLAPMEFGILEFLARNAGRPVSVAGLITAVWKNAPGTTAETVRVQMCTLRRKLEPEPSRPRFIVTDPWIGYRFLAEPEAPD